MFVNSAHPN
jgi:hypothetical protein